MKQESLKFSGRASNPATKKFSPAQIAAQKLFAERARAGTLGNTAKRNPEPSHDFARIGKPFAFDGRTWKVSQYSHNGKTIEAYTTDRKKFVRREFDVSELMMTRRKTNPDKAKPRAYVKRASQATGAPPSKRLVTRRKKALTAPAGYFPNPKVKKLKKYYQVSIMQEGLHTKFMGLANFFTFSEAENYANHLAKQHKNWTIRVHDIRAM
jgi:hypothetical protein